MTPPLLNLRDSLDELMSCYTEDVGSDATFRDAASSDQNKARNKIHRFELCLSEFKQLQTIITWYDEAAMLKKSWGTAVWSIISAFGIHSANAVVVLIGLAALVGYAMSELTLRRYQRRYVVRAENLNAMFVQDDLSDYQLSLMATAGRTERAREFWYALKQPHFTLYYSFFVAISVACATYIAS